MIQRIASRLVDHLYRMVCIPDDEIGDKPGPQLSVGFPAAQRLRGMARDASPGFLGRQAKLDAGHVHRQVQAGKRAGAGVIVGGDRHWHALFSELFHRRTLALLQKIERAGNRTATVPLCAIA